MTLNEVAPGQTATVVRVHGKGAVQRRLVDMGIVAKTPIKVFKLAPLGDPMEVKVKNFNLALRKSEAAMIEVTVDA